MEKITIVSKKDLEISYFCGSGHGGQARNKVASGVLISHLESGAQGRCSDSRSQLDNRREAFLRLVKHPRFKFWLSRRLYEIKNEETLEQTIEKEISPEFLKLEIKNEKGQWTEVSSEYFETEQAKKES